MPVRDKSAPRVHSSGKAAHCLRASFRQPVTHWAKPVSPFCCAYRLQSAHLWLPLLRTTIPVFRGIPTHTAELRRRKSLLESPSECQRVCVHWWDSFQTPWIELCWKHETITKKWISSPACKVIWSSAWWSVPRTPSHQTIWTSDPNQEALFVKPLSSNWPLLQPLIT